jgi:hypothetical protein
VEVCVGVHMLLIILKAIVHVACTHINMYVAVISSSTGLAHAMTGLPVHAHDKGALKQYRHVAWTPMPQIPSVCCNTV